MGGDSYIVFDRVCKEYEMGEVSVHALNDINLEVRKGEFMVILGPSGSGKTTLLNAVGGLDNVTSGALRVGGGDVTGYDRKQLLEYRREQIGFIFQFFNLIPTLTALENVAFAVELTGTKDRKDAVDALESVGLGDRLEHFPSQLSGGEQQRVAIARALSKNPPILLADEPTGELDYQSGVMILKLLQQINKRDGLTIILVTHNGVVGEIGDRVVHMHSGEIADIRENENPKDASEIRW